MAVQAEVTSSRIQLCDNKKKLIASFSKTNPDADVNDVMAFADAVSALMEEPADFIYRIKEEELTDV
jgi:hypothetical protein